MHRQDEDEDRGRGGQGRQGNGYEYGYGMDQDQEEQDRNPGNRGGYGNRRQRGLRQSDGRNHTSNDGGQCVAQCFFEEMNMVGDPRDSFQSRNPSEKQELIPFNSHPQVDGNGMPDRRKVSYLLTKDLRDRELRNFFTDTVQQCFRYLESNGRGRHHKCSAARELVKCMSEYAKAQCEDWEEHGNMLFN